MRALIRFLGGIYLALFLIGSTAVWVIAGTFIEAATDSHAHASYYSYGNPFFLALLGGYFVNILVSALRRWPFRRKHVGFLITHLGLLMLLSGTIIKVVFGTQGVLGLTEGASTSRIFIPGTEVLHVQYRDHAEELPIDSLALRGRSEHCSETIEQWIKGDRAIISGLSPIPVHDFDGRGPIKISYVDDDWQVVALRAHDPQSALKALFLQQAQLHWLGGEPSSWELELELSTLLGLDKAEIQWSADECRGRCLLLGADAGLIDNLSRPWEGAPSIRVRIEAKPTLAIIQDLHGDELLAFISRNGALHTEQFRHNTLTHYISYDNGYAGYRSSVQVPATHMHPSFQDLEAAQLHQLAEQLRAADELSPPLEVLRKACGQEDFVPVCLAFLQDWNASGKWLYAGLVPPIELSEELRAGALWVANIIEELLPQLAAGKDFFESLEKMHWPLIEQLREWSEGLDTDELITLLAQQILSVSHELPDTEPLGRDYSDSELLSALFQAYGIHLRHLRAEDSQELMLSASHLPELPRYELECPLTRRHQDLPKLAKWEDMLPRIDFDWKGERISLAFDRYGTGLLWPTANGEALLRYQPRFEHIPYSIRLRDCRQINYAGSGQPFSYESDLIITDRRTGEATSCTISMNNVYETRDGYRFYMANILPPQEIKAQQAQIVVNRDPAKYWLSYPGASILCLGILLLFFGRKRL